MIEIIKDYQLQTSRTDTNLDSCLKNETHYILGFITEFGELSDGYKKQLAYNKELDFVNVGEEWADFGWYLGRYTQLLLKELNITSDEYYDYLIEFGYDHFDNFFAEIMLDEYEKDVVKPMLLTSFIPALNKVMENQDKESLLIFTSWWWTLGKELGINREKALSNNLNKLKLRYPEKFTSENAINRDLDGERKILES
tara:strand:- start:24581 stop:25174 length:594 start_codon:yes stop_codon:yes gene_type:complete